MNREAFKSYFKPKKRQYKTKTHNIIEAVSLYEAHRRGDIAEFDTCSDLEEKCRAVGITYRWFRNWVKSTNREIFIQDKKRSKIDLTKYEQNEKGQYLIPREHMTPYLRNYASKHHIKLKTKKD